MNRPSSRVMVSALLWVGLGSSAVAHATDFKWCRPLKRFSQAEILGADVPAYQSEFARSAPVTDDGEWDYDLPLAEVWRAYTQTPLSRVWSSSLIRYSYAIAPGARGPIDESAGATWPGLSEGMRFFLEIKGDPFGWACKLGMGLKVTQIIRGKLIKFEYVDFSPAFGQQWIRFEAIDATHTRVRHFTRYRGKDALVDSTYPIYHHEAIPALHEAIQKMLRKKDA